MKTNKKEMKSDDKSKKSSEEIAKMIHPHDDEPDPTAYMGNYNTLKCFLLSVLELQLCLLQPLMR